VTSLAGCALLSPPFRSGRSVEATLTGHSGHVTSLAVTADSGTLVSNNQIKLWDLATLTSNTDQVCLCEYNTLLRRYDYLLFDHDITAMLGHWRVTALPWQRRFYPDFGSSDGVLRVWDLTTKQLLRVQEVIRARFATFDDDRLRDYIRL